VDALKAVVAVEQDATATKRAEDLIVGFGAKAVGRLTPLIGDSRWFVQRRGAQILGRIAAPEAVPLLQPLLRQSDTRVAQAAVCRARGDSGSAAARAIQTVLRAASGDMRRAVTAALVAGKDPAWCRCSCKSSRRANRSARITRWYSRRSTRWPALAPTEPFRSS